MWSLKPIEETDFAPLSQEILLYFMLEFDGGAESLSCVDYML